MKEVMIKYIEESEEVKNIRENYNEEAIGRYMEKYESGTSKPILVKGVNRQKYILIDGHHRLEAKKRLKKKKIDVKVLDITDEEIFDKAVESNQDHGIPLTREEENEVLKTFIEQGKTQQEIAKIFHITQSAIAMRIKRNPMLDLSQSDKTNISSINEVLSGRKHEDIAKDYGLSRSRITQIWNDWKNGITDQYESGTSKDKIIEQEEENKINLTLESLNEFLKEDYNELIQGDCLKEIPNLKDGSVDCVVIDPPYGISYQSNYRKEKHGQIKDDNKNAFELLDKSLKLVFNKMKKKSHIYIFTSWKVIEKVKPIIEKHFELKNCIVWNKNNWGMGDLQNNYAEKYELILFASKGNRPLYSETRPLNVIDCERVDTKEHPTKKPINLLKELITNSTEPKDLVLDYFAGSGSTLEAAQELKRKWIGIEIEQNEDWD